MAAAREDIAKWLSRADKETMTHMIVVCDRFDNEDYPVYINKGESIKEKICYYSENMQEVMEIYKLNISYEEQLNAKRAWNI